MSSLLNPYMSFPSGGGGGGPTKLEFSDTFNRTNGDPGANWTVGHTDIAIVDQAGATPAPKAMRTRVSRGACWNTPCNTLEQYSLGYQFTVPSPEPGAYSNLSRFGPAVRMSADSNSYYVAGRRVSDGRLYLDRVDNLVATGLTTYNGPAWVAGDRLDLIAEASGADVLLTVKLNNTIVINQFLNAAALTGTRVGIASGLAGNHGDFANWYGGDL